MDAINPAKFPATKMIKHGEMPGPICFFDQSVPHVMQPPPESTRRFPHSTEVTQQKANIFLGGQLPTAKRMVAQMTTGWMDV